MQETKPLTRADIREAMQKLKENNGKQNPLPDCLTQAFVQGSGYWGWYRFITTGVHWMEAGPSA